MAEVRVEMRAVARVRLRRLQGLTSGSVMLVGGGRGTKLPHPRRPAAPPRLPGPACCSRLPSPARSKAQRSRCHEQGCDYTAARNHQLGNHGKTKHGRAYLAVWRAIVYPREGHGIYPRYIM